MANGGMVMRTHAAPIGTAWEWRGVGAGGSMAQENARSGPIFALVSTRMYRRFVLPRSIRIFSSLHFVLFEFLSQNGGASE